MSQDEEFKITVSKEAEKDVLDLYREEFKKMRKEIVRELEHRHQINLECAREASRLSMLEEVEKWIDSEVGKNHKDTDELQTGYIFALLETKKKIEELKQGTENSEYTTKAVPITNGIVNYVLTGK